MDRYPAAYLRRSFVDANSPGDISRESQRTAIGRLAHADGHNGDVVEYDDWGISADIAKSAKRTAYSRLLADMEEGRISAVYAFDVDRLYRDPRDLIRLQDAAQRHGVRIVTTGGPLAVGDGDDPAAEAFAFIGAVFGRMELQKAKKRARAARAARQLRGDVFGHAPYGFRHARDASGRILSEPDPERPVEPLLAAYREAGSVLGAARLLEARGIPAPRGGHRWATSGLTRIIEGAAPELLPPKAPSGRRNPTTGALLAGLMICPFCRATMTPNQMRRQLYCRNGPRERERHPRYVVREVDLLPWVKEEAARLQIPTEDGQVVQDPEAERAAIEDAFRRATKAYLAGGIDDREYDAAKVARDADLAGLAVVPQLVEIRPLDWSWTPETINGVLRAMWRYVELGPDLRPIRAEWSVPEWRAT